jgi:hypothetical protein
VIKVTSVHEVSLDQCLRVNGVKYWKMQELKEENVSRSRTIRKGFGVLLEQGPKVKTLGERGSPWCR